MIVPQAYQSEKHSFTPEFQKNRDLPGLTKHTAKVCGKLNQCWSKAMINGK
jgi:hypothetical protein